MRRGEVLQLDEVHPTLAQLALGDRVWKRRTARGKLYLGPAGLPPRLARGVEEGQGSHGPGAALVLSCGSPAPVAATVAMPGTALGEC